MRADTAEFRTVTQQVGAGTLSYAAVRTFVAKISTDIDDLWYAAYDQLQADVSMWRPPGSFAAHTSTLVRAYEAFLSGTRVVEGAGLVLGSLGGGRRTG
jgi:hypothetical protein